MKHFLTILALMFASVTAYGYTDLVTPGYQPNGSTFTKENVKVDWETQKIVALIDVTNCTGQNENILSVGKNISSYTDNDGIRFHLYYTATTNPRDMTIAYNASGETYLQEHKSITDKTLLIEISKANGITVNGVSWNKVTSDFNTAYETFFKLGTYEVGSTQGASGNQTNAGRDRSHATYKYVRVQGLNEFVTPTITVGTLPGTTALGSNPDGYKPAGSTFTTSNVSIDWSKQKLVAYIDVTSSTGDNENLLSVGKNISSYTNSDGVRFHLYYKKSAPDLTLAYNGSGEKYLQNHKSFTDKTLLIEISKANGFTINGVSWNKDDVTYDDFFKLGNYEVGSAQFNTGFESRDCSHATYNYIRVVDIDTQMPSEDLTFAETETESDAQTTLSGKNNTMLSSLTLTRTLTADEWNTFCVPFNITDLSAFGAVKEFDKVSGSTMLFKDATSIVAGKPYLVKPKTSYIENPKFVYPTITSDTPDANVSNDNTYNFVGVYGTHEFTSSNASTSYILVSGGSLVNPTANTTMNGMRAYFTYTMAGGVAPRVAIDGVETALSEVVGSEEITDGRIYNLRGMYVGNDESRLAKGIYIKNGKKVVLN